MTLDQAIIGQRVRTNRAWANVPVNTEGVIWEIYETPNWGVMVGWDLPDQPLPTGFPDDWHPKACSGILSDGFSESELKYLEVVETTEKKT